jgi:MoxR-like ATPase
MGRQMSSLREIVPILARTHPAFRAGRETGNAASEMPGRPAPPDPEVHAAIAELREANRRLVEMVAELVSMVKGIREGEEEGSAGGAPDPPAPTMASPTEADPDVVLMEMQLPTGEAGRPERDALFDVMRQTIARLDETRANLMSLLPVSALPWLGSRAVDFERQRAALAASVLATRDALTELASMVDKGAKPQPGPRAPHPGAAGYPERSSG